MSRETHVTDLVVGRRASADALQKRPGGVQEVLYCGSTKAKGIQEVMDLARAAGVKVRRVERTWLDQQAHGANHQGVALRLAGAGYTEFADVLQAAQAAGNRALLVMADHIQDPHNLGAIIRSAAAAGAQGLIVAKDRSCPLTPAVAKAASGGLQSLPVARVTNLSNAAEDLKQAGIWLLGASTRGEQAPWDLDLAVPLCLVIGGEHKGIGPRLEKAMDLLASLPLAGGMESLNASVAAGVLLFEIVRQRAMR